MKDEAIDNLDPGPRHGMAHPGYPRDIPALGDLRLHQGAGAKGIAAVRGQAVIQNVVFQYGTSLSEPFIPEPASLLLLAPAALVAVRRRPSRG